MTPLATTLLVLPDAVLQRCAGGLPFLAHSVRPGASCSSVGLKQAYQGWDGTTRTMQRKPMWQVEVSIPCAIRAAGR